MARGTELVRIRRGAYATAPDKPLDPRVAHLQLLEATVAQSSAESVVSHASAAVLHGLPIGNDQLSRVHLTRDREGQGKIRRYVQMHGLSLDDGDVIMLGGFRVTSLARTVLDMSCAFRPLLAVPLGDAALRAGLSTDALTRQLARAGARHGIRQARRTAALLDPRSESPGESMSRVVFVDHRIPASRALSRPSAATRERRQGRAWCRLDDQGVEQRFSVRRRGRKTATGTRGRARAGGPLRAARGPASRSRVAGRALGLVRPVRSGGHARSAQPCFRPRPPSRLDAFAAFPRPCGSNCRRNGEERAQTSDRSGRVRRRLRCSGAGRPARTPGTR
jgi:hypothetical protein